MRAALRRVPRAAWGLLLLALVVRLAFVAATPDYTPAHDDRDYDRLACALVEGGGYPAVGPTPTEADCGEPLPDSPRTAFRPPGHPFVLAGVYAVAEPLGLDRRLAARMVEALLGTAAVALIGAIAALLWGRRTALVALGLGALYLPLVLVGGSLITEPLFVTLMLGALAAALVHRRSPRGYRWVVAAGVLAGLAWLTRTNGALLLVPLAAAVWGPRPRLSRASIAAPLALVAVAAAVVAPWVVRNSLAFDRLTPVTTEAGSALVGTYNDRAREDPDRPGAWRPPARLAALEPILGEEPPEPVAQRRLITHSLEYMADHPGYVLEVMGRNVVRLANLDGADWWRHSARTISSTNAAGDAAAWCFFAFALLALAGLATGAARGAPWWLWATPVLFLLSVVAVVGETRFRAPIEPFVVLLAALAVARITSRDARGDA